MAPEMMWLMGAWVACLGGAVGSFMNVVIFRVPAGKSIVHPGSRCPKCHHAIRARDNVPVLSWLLLKGRCRDCGETISARYPAVETFVAATFVLLAVAEVFSCGANLPVGADGLIRRGALALADVYWVLYAYHVLLICTLTCTVLIEYDGNRLPLKLIGPVIVVGFLAPIFFPELRPVPLWPEMPSWVPSTHSLAGLLDSVAGLAGAGLMVGAAYLATGSGPLGRAGRGAAAWNVMLVGIFLGWQAVVGVVALASAVQLLMVIGERIRMRRGGVPFSAGLLAGGLAWIPAWRQLSEQFPLAGGGREIAGAAIVIVAVFLVSALSWAIASTGQGADDGTS